MASPKLKRNLTQKIKEIDGGSIPGHRHLKKTDCSLVSHNQNLKYQTFVKLQCIEKREREREREKRTGSDSSMEKSRV